eukprot:2287318-Rhodomonas_salina.1
MQEGGSLHRHTIERWLHAVAGRVAQQLNNYMFCAILQESVLALEMVLHGHCTLAWCNVAWCNTDMHMAYAQSQPDARLFQHDDLLESYRLYLDDGSNMDTHLDTQPSPSNLCPVDITWHLDYASVCWGMECPPPLLPLQLV